MAAPPEWRREILRVATSWLIDEEAHAVCPRRVLLPLENPDLHDPGVFTDQLDGVRTYRGVAVGRAGAAEVGIVDSKLGAAAVAMALDVLAGLRVTTVVGVGFCGALHRRLACGDLVIPDVAFRDESVSARYCSSASEPSADVALVERLRRGAHAGGHRHEVGSIVTTDVATREDSVFVRTWTERGAIGVDMETSALLAIARDHGMRAAALLVVSDNAASFAPSTATTLVAGVEAAAGIAVAALGESQGG